MSFLLEEFQVMQHWYVLLPRKKLTLNAIPCLPTNEDLRAVSFASNSTKSIPHEY